MKLSYKYRIYPNKEQQEILQKNFNFCCFLYNSALQERISYYKNMVKAFFMLINQHFFQKLKRIFTIKQKIYILNVFNKS